MKLRTIRGVDNRVRLRSAQENAGVLYERSRETEVVVAVVVVL